MIDVHEIVILQQKKNQLWHQIDPSNDQTGFLKIVTDNHLRNFLLWHEEDKARRDDLGFEYVYHAKRKIDAYNQERNNFIEAMDKWVFEKLAPNPNCPVNSETPGMMIDRLSILSLKEYHMHEQAERKDANQEHQERCQVKLAVIVQQIKQLQNCLQELLQGVAEHTRTFRVYYQFKMYNDPNLNPQLYRHVNNVGSE